MGEKRRDTVVCGWASMGALLADLVSVEASMFACGIARFGRSTGRGY